MIGHASPLAAMSIAIAAATVAVTLTAGSAPAQQFGPVTDTGATTLLMHYMPWYIAPPQRDRWGPHWTGWERQHDPEQVDRRGLPDIQSNYRPLIGPYDSSDPAVLECHLLQMKLAGIDGVIVDWYGISDAADYPPSHEATRAMFEAAGRLGMKFSVCFEDRTVQLQVDRGLLEPADIADHLAQTFRWMDENWFAAEHYARFNGRPLVLNFGPVFVKDADTWAKALAVPDVRPAFFALHHLWKGVNADGGFTWVHKNAWHDATPRDPVRARLLREYTYQSADPMKVIPSATPGFNDIYPKSYGYLAHRGGQTLRESLDVCMAGDWPLIQLVTWNDYGEGTMFEPTHEFGYLFLEIVQQARRDDPACNLPFTAHDLRLPARLLALRRAGNAVSADRLDDIARLLAQGRPGPARGMIEAAEREIATP